MKTATISIIIPVYNGENYLAEAIKSILQQSLQASEIIVVDDGSTDGSAAVASKFIPQIKLIRQGNKGAASARNHGIKLAKGDFLAFLDADDLWTNEKLKIQFQYLEDHPETDMVFGSVEQFISPELSEEHKNNLREELKKMPGFVLGNLLIRKDSFQKVGLLDEKLEIGEFIDWFSRAKDLGLKYFMFDDVLMRRRIHTNNMGLNKRQHLTDYTSILRAALARKRMKNKE